MLRKVLLSAAVALMLAAPPLASSASADTPKFCRNGKGHPVYGAHWCRERGYWPRDVRYHRHYRSSWDIVQSDRCLRREYQRFAREHKNPNKRARFVEYLAREGCPHPERYSRYDDYRHRGASEYYPAPRERGGFTIFGIFD